MKEKRLLNKFIVTMLFLPALSSCNNLFSSKITSSNELFNALKADKENIVIGSNFTIKTTDDFFSIIENLRNKKIVGNNRTITIANETNGDFKFLGLFQTISDSKVSDLNIVYDFPINNGGNKRGFGGLAYTCDSSVIENVKLIYNYDVNLVVTSNFFSYSKYEEIGTIGGLVANLVGESKVNRCLVSGNFAKTSSAIFGGVIGYQSVSSTMTNSSFEGSINNVGNQRAYINRIDQSACGGIVGYLSGEAYGNYAYIRNLNASMYNETWSSFTYSAGGLYGCVAGDAHDSYIDYSNEGNISFDLNEMNSSSKAISNKRNSGVIIGNVISTGKVKNIYADMKDFVGGEEFNGNSNTIVYGVGASDSLNCSNIYTVNNTHFFKESKYFEMSEYKKVSNYAYSSTTSYSVEVSDMFDFTNVKFDITSDSNDNKTLNNFVFTLNNSNQINEYTLQPEKITNSILGYSVQFSTVIMEGDFFYSIEALVSITNKSFELVITKQHKKVLYNSIADIVNDYSDIKFSGVDHDVSWKTNAQGKYMLKGISQNIKN